MNIIDPEVTFNPNTMKLIHCSACDTTWAAKKIPAVCPYCGKPKGKNGVGTASEDASMSWGEEYMEMMARKADSSENTDSSEEGSGDTASEDEYGEYSENSSYSDEYGSSEEYGSDGYAAQMGNDVSQDTGSYEEYDTDTYEPIGYDPDELANNMSGKKRVSKVIRKQLIADAEKSVKETKWALQRAGLPTDACQNILPEIRNKADSLEGYLPDYAGLMIKMVVDSTLQQELRHPRKGKVYTIPDVNDMLSELDISENYWESYYAVAGLM